MRLERARASAYCSMLPPFSSSRPLVSSSRYGRMRHQVKRQRPPMRWHSWCRSHYNSLLWPGSCFLDRKHETARRASRKSLRLRAQMQGLSEPPPIPGGLPADAAAALRRLGREASRHRGRADRHCIGINRDRRRDSRGRLCASRDSGSTDRHPSGVSQPHRGATRRRCDPSRLCRGASRHRGRADRHRIGTNRDCRRDRGGRLSAGRDSGSTDRHPSGPSAPP